jgi:NAD(P)-dependent dehydrogenase (short-subunit alcohol dehydrogenase family)
MSGVSAAVAIVVGGASGLGASTARALCAGGRRVVIVDRDEERAEALAAELGASARAIAADVTDDEAVARAFDRAAESGTVRAVVCCAGLGWAEKVLGRRGLHTVESFDRIVDVNLRGSFHVLRHGARVMAENEQGADGERGVCVLTSSIAAEDGQVGQVAYAATKAAVAGMVLPAARDLASVGIRVCAIAPGTFDTPLLAGLPEPARAQLAEQVPFPARLGDPAEFASLVLEILRNRMLNGALIRLDGALRMPFTR